MNIRKEHLVLLTILLIVIAGSGVLIWQVVYQKDPAMNFTGRLAEDDERTYGEEQKMEDNKEIYVHITGGVKKPGVYKLEMGARIIDALKAAGGKTDGARTERINLAAKARDGQKIIIPLKQEEGVQKKEEKEVKIMATTAAGININTADKSRLEELPGIGPSKAKNIIDFRERIGKFEDLNQLLMVKGIGDKTLEKIRDELTLY